MRSARLVSAGSKQSAQPLKRQTFWLYDVSCSPRAVRSSRSPTSTTPVSAWALTGAGAKPSWHRRLACAALVQALPRPQQRQPLRRRSCWYPGSSFDHAGSDRCFDAIRREVEQGRGIDHLLLVGDQIYADATREVFDIAEHRERYQESSIAALSRVGRSVLGHVPTYFAVDDHEFTDNYPASILGGPLGNEPEPDGLLSDAAREAWNFQMHHAEEAFGTTNRLWYGFKALASMASSSTRAANGSAAIDWALISAEQKPAYIDWLDGGKSHDRPLFLVTGSPVAPFPIDEVKHPARAP